MSQKPKTLSLFSDEYIANFQTQSLLAEKVDEEILSPEGTTYTSVYNDPAKVDEFMTAPGEEKIMKAVQDPSEIAGAKAEVKGKEDELALESMKSNLQQDQDSILKSNAFNFGTSNNIMGDFSPLEINTGKSFDNLLQKGAKDLTKAEYERIEKLLFETVPNYVGGAKDNTLLNFDDRQRIARKISFADRKNYVKRHYPEASYFRMPIARHKGKTIYEELMSLSPNGDVFRVDPSGALTMSEIFKDVGDGFGSYVNFRNAGSIGGAIFGAPSGPGVLPAVFGGSYFGQILDKALADEGIDPTDAEGFWQRIQDKDAAIIASFDTAMMVIPPALASAISRKMMNERIGTIVVDSVLPVGKVVPEAVEAQLTAQTILPKIDGIAPELIGGQVTQSALLKGIVSQVGATSTKIGEVLTRQKKSIAKYLSEAVENSGLNSLSPKELQFYVSSKLGDSTNLLKSIIERNMNSIRYQMKGSKTEPLPKNQYQVGSGELNSQKFITTLQEVKDANYKLNNDIWKTALNSNNSKNIQFDTTSLAKLAKELQLGVQTKVDRIIPEEKIQGTMFATSKATSPTDYVTPSKVVSEAEQIVTFPDQITKLLKTIVSLSDNKIANFTVSTPGGGSKTFGALEQLQAIRQKLNAYIKADKPEPKLVPGIQAIIDEIDNVVLNPKDLTGAPVKNATFLQRWKEGSAYYKQNKDIESFSNLGVLFSREATVNPHNYMKKFFNGEWGMPELNMLNKYISTIKQTGTKEMKNHALNLNSSLQNSFADYILYNPIKGVKRLESLMANPDLFKAFVPNSANRKAYQDFFSQQKWITGGTANKVLEQSNQRIGNGKEFLKDANETEIWEFINQPLSQTYKPKNIKLVGQKFDKVGVNSERGNDLRSALLDDLLAQAQTLYQGQQLTNVSAMVQVLNNLTNFRGSYAKYKPLFVPSKASLENNEIVYTKPSKYLINYLDNLKAVARFTSFVKDSPDVGGAFSAGSARAGLTGFSFQGIIGGGKVIFGNEFWARMLANPISVGKLKEASETQSLLLQPRMLRAVSQALNSAFEPLTKPFPNAGSYKETIKEELDRTKSIQPEGIGPQSSIAPNTMPLQNLSPAPSLASLQVPKSNVKSSKVDYGLLFPNDSLGEAINQRKEGIMGLT